MDYAQRDIDPRQRHLDMIAVAGDEQQRHQRKIQHRHLEQIGQIVGRHLDRPEVAHRRFAMREIVGRRRVAADVAEALDEHPAPDRVDQRYQRKRRPQDPDRHDSLPLACLCGAG
jgi:hypothetical protein